ARTKSTHFAGEAARSTIHGAALGLRQCQLSTRPYRLAARPYRLSTRPYRLAARPYRLSTRPYRLAARPQRAHHDLRDEVIVARLEDVHHRAGDVVHRHGIRRTAAAEVEARADGPRIHASHLDPVVAHLLHERLAEAAHGELRGVVGPQAWVAQQPGDGCDVDDVPAEPALRILPAHVRNHGLCAEEDAACVDGHGPVPILDADLVDGARHPDARVVDEDVDPSGLGRNPLDGLLNLIGITHVAHDGMERLPDVVGRAPQALLAAREAVDVRPAIDQMRAEGEPDAAARARHDGNFVA